MDGNGAMDNSKFLSYQRFMEDYGLYLLSQNNPVPIDKAEASPRKRLRGRLTVGQYIDEQGILQRITPYKSNWYFQYILHPATSQASFFKKFRRRFRIPYPQFLEFVQDCKANNWFKRWTSKDATGKPSSPLELMLLGALRYLGRGWTFDDLEENTGIDEETHRQFFHCFIDVGSTFLYQKYVVMPTNPEQAANHMYEMNIAGFPGCIGSTDATHILIEKCSSRLRNQHLAAKLPGTARTYNATVNHRRRILSTTTGHPCRWNDKTLILFDTFACGIYRGDNALKDVVFELFERDADGNVISVTYNGCYVIVDNGYLSWSTTVPPTKSPLTQKELRWSQWLESLRKDVECTFGILKGRWRILKTGIRLHGVDAPDKVWLTCCALHNWLIDIDGLDSRWEAGVSSDWEGELGQLNGNDVELFASRHSREPFAIQRLRSVALAGDELIANYRNFDTSGMGPGNEDDGAPLHVRQEEPDPNADVTVNEATENGVRVVRKLSLAYFKERLIEHFDIMWQRKQIIWPRRIPPRYNPIPNA
jgi:hypothetical protein